MEVHELKEIIEDKFTDLDTRIGICFKNIDDKNTVTDKAIESLSRKVTTHEHWLWFMRGVGALIVILLGWIGVKIRF